MKNQATKTHATDTSNPPCQSPLSRPPGGSRTVLSASAILMVLLFSGLPPAAWGAAGPKVGDEPSWPNPDWPRAAPAEAGMDGAALAQARDYALTGGGSGCILRHGKRVLAWGDPKQLYDLKSTTKSFGATALGLAVMDGHVRLDDLARKFCPDLGVPPETNAQTGWLDKITLRMLATQTAGFEKPGGFGRLLFEPGTKWHYSDGGPNWLADCLTRVYRRDLNEVMFERVFNPIGIGRQDLRWRNNAYRPRQLDGIARREFGAGISANIEAMSRFGYLYLREGRWNDRQLLEPSFVALARRSAPDVARLPVLEPPTPADRFGSSSAHYGLLWWNNNDGTLADAPRDAFWTWGLYDSLVVVIPSLDLVVARAGKSWQRHKGAGHYEVLKPFLGPICAAARPASRRHPAAPPVPTSPVIRQIRWAPRPTIVRRARGSDNWPMTWADDDALYAAYGDGNGFEPFTPEKLSLGFARITGSPSDFRGVNLRSPTGEARGDGARGRKASGLLCVEGVLYLLARNAGNAQLAWSGDHGATWTWASWKFTSSFGCPTFLNFQKNYAGARDAFVYLYSPDHDNAYEPADRMALARVPSHQVRVRDAYEFFVQRDAKGQPVWTKDIARRGAVFMNPGRCYRSGVTFHAPLNRYLWVQILPQSGHPQGPRFQGGFGVYDAPEPWGPWTTAFFTERWDVGPGETACLPAKWMSADGRTVHLVFSGDDHFSVRQGTLVPQPQQNTGSP
ncbi:MAG: serine hydrolase [Verrucomicrobia bacterium]|nr:serine hydrolase [Verrucomicrobiota bacterium]